MAVITMREAISQALWEEMERDENVFILGEEVGVGEAHMQLRVDSMIILGINVYVTHLSPRTSLSVLLMALQWSVSDRLPS